MASEVGTSSAEPSPVNARPPIRIAPFGAAAQTIEPTTINPMPATNTRMRP
jgi:hypothetical protein